MTSGAKDVLLVDLDGTLLRGNSFHMWLKYIVTGGLKTVAATPRWRCRFNVLLFSAMRFSRLLDHAAWKRLVQKAWAAAMDVSRDPAGELDGFLSDLKVRIDRNLLSEIHEAQANQTIAVLTTAAPAEYANVLAENLGFDAIVATPRGDSAHWCHNIGTVKKHRTLALLKDRRWHARRRILYTDHLDDLPLMAESEKIHLVWENSEKALRRICQEIKGMDVRIYSRMDGET